MVLPTSRIVDAEQNHILHQEEACLGRQNPHRGTTLLRHINKTIIRGEQRQEALNETL